MAWGTTRTSCSPARQWAGPSTGHYGGTQHAFHPDTITDRFNRLVDRAGSQAHPPSRCAAHLRDNLTRLRGGPKIVADRIGHANMAYTLAIYTHKSTGKGRDAAETVGGVLLGAGWACSKCKAVYIGIAPAGGLCGASPGKRVGTPYQDGYPPHSKPTSRPITSQADPTRLPGPFRPRVVNIGMKMTPERCSGVIFPGSGGRI